MFKGVLGIRR